MKKLISLILIVSAFILLTQFKFSPFKHHWRKLKIRTEMFLFQSKGTVRHVKKENKKEQLIKEKEIAREMRKPSKLTRSDQIIEEMN